jgi:hypothetical protein
MNKNIIGRIKNLTIIPEDDSMEITVLIVDPKFKKKLLRDLSLSGNLRIEGTQVIFVDKEENA